MPSAAQSARPSPPFYRTDANAGRRRNRTAEPGPKTPNMPQSPMGGVAPAVPGAQRRFDCPLRKRQQAGTQTLLNFRVDNV